MKQETLEEALKNELESIHSYCRNFDFDLGFKTGVVIGAKWQQEKLCSSEVIQRIRATKSDAEARRIIRTI